MRNGARAMSDLLAFLAARLDEDEAAHKASAIGPFEPRRALREVAAKRAILARCEPFAGTNLGQHLQWSQEQQGLHFALHQMAAVYSDHPDYDQEWRP